MARAGQGCRARVVADAAAEGWELAGRLTACVKSRSAWRLVRVWSACVATPVRGSGCLGHGLSQAGEARYRAVEAGQGEDTRNQAVRGDDQPQLAAVCLGQLVRSQQGMQPAAITEPGNGQIHHDRDIPQGGRGEENRAELVRGSDVNLRGRF